jgi:hypothetical protein
MTRAAKHITETKRGLDRDLTVTQANVRKHRETLDLKIRLN